jgi:hypothetical protein
VKIFWSSQARKDLRAVRAASHRIIYRVLLDEVEIVTLVHFAQRLNTKRLR